MKRKTNFIRIIALIAVFLIVISSYFWIVKDIVLFRNIFFGIIGSMIIVLVRLTLPLLGTGGK